MSAPVLSDLRPDLKSPVGASAAGWVDWRGVVLARLSVTLSAGEGAEPLSAGGASPAAGGWAFLSVTFRAGEGLHHDDKE